MYSIEMYYGHFNMAPGYYLDTSMMECYGIHCRSIYIPWYFNMDIIQYHGILNGIHRHCTMVPEEHIFVRESQVKQ